MAFQFPNVSDIKYKGPDYTADMTSGLNSYLLANKAKYADQNQQQDLKKKLSDNIIADAKAQYAALREKAGLENTEASTEGTRANTQGRNISNKELAQRLHEQLVGQQYSNSAKRSEINLNKQLNDALNGSTPQPEGASINIPPINGENEKTNEQKSNIVNQGNPNMYHVDELYDNNLAVRKELEKRGYKKTQTTKYDPKTGNSVVITQYPSGKVEISNSGVNSDFSQNTNAVKTKAQSVINGVDNALPIIDKLIEDTRKGVVPGQFIGKYFSPNQQATYGSNISKSAETIANALGYPGTGEGFHQAEKTIARQPRETDASYQKRLEDLREELKERKKRATGIASQGTRIKDASNNNDPLGLR